MYAVTAWIVQPLTCLLVGTKMKKLQQTTKQNQTTKKQQSIQRDINDHELTEQFRIALNLFKRCKREEENGTLTSRDKSRAFRAQAVIDRYLMSRNLPATDMEKYLNIAKTRREYKFEPNKDEIKLRQLVKNRNCVTVANSAELRLKRVKYVHWPIIAFHIAITLETIEHSQTPCFEPVGFHKGFFLIRCNSESARLLFFECLAKIPFIISGMHLVPLEANQIDEILINQACIKAEKKERRKETATSHPLPTNINDETETMETATSHPLPTNSTDETETMETATSHPLPKYSTDETATMEKTIKFQRHQGFQLSINYFDSDSEDSEFPENSSRFLDVNEESERCRSMLTPPTTYSNNLNEPKLKTIRDRAEKTYKRALFMYQKLSNIVEPSRKQRSRRNNARREILKYESTHGISSSSNQPHRSTFDGSGYFDGQTEEMSTSDNMSSSWRNYNDAGEEIGRNFVPNYSRSQNSSIDSERMSSSNIPNSDFNFNEETEENFGPNHSRSQNYSIGSKRMPSRTSNMPNSYCNFNEETGGNFGPNSSIDSDRLSSRTSNMPNSYNSFNETGPNFGPNSSTDSGRMSSRTSNMPKSDFNFNEETGRNFGPNSSVGSERMSSRTINMPNSYFNFNEETGRNFGPNYSRSQNYSIDSERMASKTSNMKNSYNSFKETGGNFDSKYARPENFANESSFCEPEKMLPMTKNMPNSSDENTGDFGSKYLRPPYSANDSSYFQSKIGRAAPEVPTNFRHKNENSRSSNHKTELTFAAKSRNQTETQLLDKLENFRSKSYQDKVETFPKFKRVQDDHQQTMSQNYLQADILSTSRNNYQKFSEQEKTANTPRNLCTSEYHSSAIFNPKEIGQTNTEDLFNTTNNVKESTKMALEKRIFECLNSVTEEIKTTPEMEIPINSKKTLISYPAAGQLKRRLDNLQKNTNVQQQAITDVIILSDDDSDVEEIKSIDVEQARKEYLKALDYLRKLKGCDLKSLNDAEKLQYKICRHKVEKYDRMNAFKDRPNRSMESKKYSKQNDMKATPAKQSRFSSSISSGNTSSPQVSCTQQQQGFWRTGSGESFSNNALSTIASSTSTNSQSGYVTTQENDMNCEPVRSNPQLQIAIIDRNNKHGKISEHDWLQIEKGLLEQLAREIQQTNNNKIGMFDGMYWRYGIKIIQCENMDSLNFIRRVINKQKDIYFPHRQYEVIPVSELPKRSIVKVWIPPPIILHDMAVFKILKAQNSRFYSLDWTFINSRENGQGKDLYISISATSLEWLRYKKGEIRYGSNRLKMILPDES